MLDDVDLTLIDAIKDGILYSREFHQKFKLLGFEIACELYDCSTQNLSFESTQFDSENPRNWRGYKTLSKQFISTDFLPNLADWLSINQRMSEQQKWFLYMVDCEHEDVAIALAEGADLTDLLYSYGFKVVEWI